MSPTCKSKLAQIEADLYRMSCGPEHGHIEADSLLLDALLALDAYPVVAAYLDARKRIGFQYA